MTGTALILTDTDTDTHFCTVIVTNKKNAEYDNKRLGSFCVCSVCSVKCFHLILLTGFGSQEEAGDGNAA